MLHRMSSGLGIFYLQSMATIPSIAAKNNRPIHVSEMPDSLGIPPNSFFSQPHPESLAFNVARVLVPGRVGSLGSALPTGVEELLLWNLR